MKGSANNRDMDLIEVFDKDVLDFLARRHGTSIEGVIGQFLKQSNIGADDHIEYGFTLEANEVEILKDYYLRGVPVM